MDNKSLELYHEEQRQLTKDLKSSVDSLLGVFSQKVAVELEPQESIKIDGSVQVNTEKQVEVSNLQEVVTELQTLSKTLDQTIKDNKVTVPDEVVVKNISESKQDTIKISNLTELAKYFNNLTRSIEDNQPIVNVTKQVVEFPTSANNPIAVRLSDGKSFYKAINTAISGGFSSAGLATTARQDAIITAIENSAGLIPESYDEIELTYVTSGNGIGEIETVVYKDGGATVATLTLSYNADNKLSGVARS